MGWICGTWIPTYNKTVFSYGAAFGVRGDVTDSFYMHTNQASMFDARPSFEGGPHRVSNFRSFHPGGAFFVYCDGHVQWLSEDIDMSTYQALSTIKGREVISNDF